MALEIVGAGLGRTGTMSLKLALEQLGFDPCHHMAEVFKRPEQPALWKAAFEDTVRPGGAAPDWDRIFQGFKASVDWPSCHFWRDLALHYPRSKVILSRRDPEAWWASMNNTILKPMRQALAAPDTAEGMPAMFKAMIRAAFGAAHPDDKDAVLAMYTRHNEAVERTLPKERLLIYEPGEGWPRLCAFLGVAVPAAPYPKVNSTDEWNARFNTRN